MAAEFKMRAPLIPNGCPIAIAPPLMFILSSVSLRPHALVHAKLWAAKASFSSIISMSLKVRPALFSALFEDSTGPIPIIRGSTPIAALDTILANGSR